MNSSVKLQHQDRYCQYFCYQQPLYWVEENAI